MAAPHFRTFQCLKIGVTQTEGIGVTHTYGRGVTQTDFEALKAPFFGSRHADRLGTGSTSFEAVRFGWFDFANVMFFFHSHCLFVRVFIEV